MPSNLKCMARTADSSKMRAAIYARISQDREGAGIKVEAQLRDCAALCESRGWTVGETFRDDDTSAYRGRVRRGYKGLCEAIAARRVNAVVVTHLDRLFRSNLELEHFISLIETTGCKVMSVQGADYDLSTSDGQFMARIVGAAARKESADKSRRIRAKQVKVAAEGRYHGGGRRPFGYGGAPLLDVHGNPVLRSDRTTGERVPVLDYRVVREDEAELIREAAHRVLRGESTWSILREWTALGVPTSSGGPWNNRSLNQILTSARVAGKRSHHGGIAAERAEWPAILDEETWLGVRAILKGRSEPVGKRPTYLLSGLVICSCGSKMRSQTIRGRRRYTCVSGPVGGCGRTSRDARRLEEYLAASIVAVWAGGGGTKDEAPETPAEVRGYEARLERLEEEYAVDGSWSKDQYLRLRAGLETKLDTARQQAASTASARLIVPDAEGWVQAGLGPWWDQQASPEQRRALVLDLVAKVVVHPVGRGYRGDCTPANTDIEWTEKGLELCDRLGWDAEDEVA